MIFIKEKCKAFLFNKNCGNTHRKCFTFSMLYPSIFLLSCLWQVNKKSVGLQIEKLRFFNLATK